MLAEQDYDKYGAWRLGELEKNPQKYIRDVQPSDFLGVKHMARQLDLKGKKVLELGCAFGDFSVWMSHRGAEVEAIELGPKLVESARKLAELNHANCRFHVGSASDPFPFADASFDVVVGLSILHHLEERPLKACLLECHRVLKAGGTAWFFEPMENSRVFDFVQNLIPIGGNEPRPSILQRRKWKEFLKTLDDRPLTDGELKASGSHFKSVRIRHYGLTSRARIVTGPKLDPVYDSIDEALLKLPFLRRFGQTALIRYDK